mmetsp:Transcript_33426/g.105940  ORF Transcript_33426/g.105940 Transcript_33426/m.105940 type:complete len:223 (-) Transcript_33426:23-691(-)
MVPEEILSVGRAPMEEPLACERTPAEGGQPGCAGSAPRGVLAGIARASTSPRTPRTRRASCGMPRPSSLPSSASSSSRISGSASWAACAAEGLLSAAARRHGSAQPEASEKPSSASGRSCRMEGGSAWKRCEEATQKSDSDAPGLKAPLTFAGALRARCGGTASCRRRRASTTLLTAQSRRASDLRPRSSKRPASASISSLMAGNALPGGHPLALLTAVRAV